MATTLSCASISQAILAVQTCSIMCTQELCVGAAPRQTRVAARSRPDKAKPSEIWERFPKFILGFIVVFAISLWLALGTRPDIAKALPAAAGEANVFRVIFFILTFFSIGVLSDFRKLWQEGLGKLAAVYVVSLFGFVIWVGLLISWLFFSGFKPPLAG